MVAVVVVVLLWVVCGFIAAWLASKKDRSVSAWFFAGLLGGPIGVICAAVARPQWELDARPKLSRHL